MKKTITLAAILFCGASVSLGSVLVATPSADGVTTTTATIKGFAYDFGKDTSFTLNNSVVSDLSAYENFKLTSVSLTSNTAAASTVKLAVYKVSDSSPESTNWNQNPGIQNFEGYVGVSGTATVSEGVVTFTFTDGLTLDPTAWYAFFYVDEDAAESSFSTISGAVSSGVGVGLNTTYYNDASISWGDMVHNNVTNANKWNSNKAVVATYTFEATSSAAAIPEPTTATLSLLALAGLAARRRRK